MDLPEAGIWSKLEMKFHPQLLHVFHLLILLLPLDQVMLMNSLGVVTEATLTMMLMMMSAMMNFPGISVERKGNSVRRKANVESSRE